MNIPKEKLKGRFEAEVINGNGTRITVKTKVAIGVAWEGRVIIVYKCKGGYEVTDLQTGMLVGYAPTKQGSIDHANYRLQRHKDKLPAILRDGKKTLKKLGIKYPVNKIV